MTYDRKGIKPDILLEALRVINDNTLIAVGSNSGFVFIGLKKQFYSDLQLIETYYKYKTQNAFRVKIEPFEPLLDRRIKEMYIRTTPNEPTLLVITVTGTESGRVWLLSEYENVKAKDYIKYVEKMRNDKQKNKR